ncbi:protein phosphatase 2C domain-containing protein [Bacillus tianshenii]|uniref:PP2C family serine/threonine-protein phosphatase n=1 Tax=Sutcliffiella tianshenii TaxID=1463404 RepID=UPI001CD5CADA|nr:PP2C family serine/threonine-protein phosphatase [Bacillus tianshenii]MCA1318378.1 protein phosphatase 2C domain-containing protein [Bacillus tianshenii]
MSISMKAFNTTSIGHNHIRINKVCEDASGSYTSDTMSIAIVADGHGSDNYPRTERGSRFAVQAAMNCVKEFMEGIAPDELDHGTNHPTIFAQLSKSILSAWHTFVEDDCTENPFSESELTVAADKYKKYYQSGKNVAKAYGTTLIIIGATKEYWFGLHIGDGKCVSVDTNGNFSQPIPWDEQCHSNITTSICDSDASEEFRYFISKEPPLAVFIGTDGIDDSYAGNDELDSFYRSVLTIFGEHGFEVGCNEVEDYLPKLSQLGSGDDVSVAGILNIEKITASVDLLKAQNEYSSALLLKSRAAHTLLSTKERMEKANAAVISELKANMVDTITKLKKANEDYAKSQRDYDEAEAAFKLAEQKLTAYQNMINDVSTDVEKEPHDIQKESRISEIGLSMEKDQSQENNLQ